MNNNLNTLLSTNSPVKKCPVCNASGISVKRETVYSLLGNKPINMTVNDQFALCMTPSCEISYYSLNSDLFYNINDITVPLWYKKDSTTRYACYCSKVTKDNVIQAIRSHGAKSVKEVNQVTGAMKNSDCLHKNPLGECCHKIIQAIIDEEMKDI